MANFRTRARTVDMLGRQQIAGLGTAISELFKNAHDAYATRVEADYYRPEQLLTLRDDGFGMTIQDIEERWLVLGTESKLGVNKELSTLASNFNMHPRMPTGEKGIGRLAIAAIGPQVLLVSRARRSDGLHPTVALFINWLLFTLPGISLDEIDIPVMQIAGGGLPTADDISSLVTRVRQNLVTLGPRIPQIDATTIDNQLKLVSIDPVALQERFDHTALTGLASGTQFYIQPTDQMLQVELDTTPERRRIGDLQKTLMGFTNTMLPNADVPPIVGEFWDHRSADLREPIIGPEGFFTPEDFNSADHQIRGRFDPYGQFAGTVSIYGSTPQQHTIVWPDARGRETECGPFTIDFAHVQGMARDSHIPHEQWASLISKLDRFGGIYIYRNGYKSPALRQY